MDKENFKKLFVEAGFKNKQELAKALNLSYSCVTQWGCGDTLCFAVRFLICVLPTHKTELCI